MKTPKSRNVNEANRQARTWEKANEIAGSLKSGGEYTAYEQSPCIWNMTKRSYSNTPDTTYTVDLTPSVPTCTCPDFAAHLNYCKHIWGLTTRLEEDAQEAQLEFRAEEEANADF